ncbi:MAG: hypothetical protein DAHOPDDO_00052 [Ignavibacteriaceae bacterium]|nr:hypothetical protein [Ignavibacteriaceae bacterium]
MNNNSLSYFNEPKLTFGFKQKIEDPRDGLILFGPNESFSKHSVEAGVVGTPVGINYYTSFVDRIKLPIYSSSIMRPTFPGFETVFAVRWEPIPISSRSINPEIIAEKLNSKSAKQRTVDVVNLYIEKVKDIILNDNARPNIFFIIVPLNIYQACRPGRKGDKLNKSLEDFAFHKKAGQIRLPYEDDEDYEQSMLDYINATSNFHHLLKARLINEGVDTPIQIIVEPTLNFRDKRNFPYSENMQAFLAWSISTTVYYKLGKIPWKLGDIRPKVCYLGLVFKKLETIEESGQVCSAAQMFLDSGDGSVFKGTVGKFKSENNEYHLTKPAASSLLELALNYYEKDYGGFPDELFIHGRARFTEDEWSGFQDAIKARNQNIKLVGIVIKDRTEKLKIYRDVIGEKCNYGSLRGLAIKISDTEGYLWTRGFVPRLNTSLSKEIPNPLRIILDRGEVDLEQAMKDILALTKLNYNACIYGDGLPVTLRFSENIGKILTAIPNFETRVRKFQYYI